MDKYKDVPMDFVDALLVSLAEERGIRDVLTLDRRGFETYRAHGRERFRIFPGS
jgi:predicted nucleic acid-binding protein